VGGGLGDIEEVLAAGRELARAGFRPILYRRAGRPLPPHVEGPWEWPRLERRDSIRPRAPAALTVSPAWGVSAATGRDEPFGRGGPWAVESADVERAYGPAATLHVSLEEFARTLVPAAEDRERFREGGVRHRDLPSRLARSRRSGEFDRLRLAFARFRGFDRPNVLHLFAGFSPSPAFARQFPEAVQTGPLWPRRFGPGSESARTGHRREWVWYASPASAERLLPEVRSGLRDADGRVHLYVRTPRPWTSVSPGDGVELATGAVEPRQWAHRFRAAELRIVTGSRTLLEAVELGGPFLYFNGVLGTGSRRRRHRPEKIVQLLALLTREGAPLALRRDLGDFARGRRVRQVVHAAATRTTAWERFPHRIRPAGFRRPYDDAGHLLVSVVRELARPPHDAPRLVTRVRAGSPL